MDFRRYRGGYVKKEKTDSGTTLITVYENNEGLAIILIQTADNKSDLSVDNEAGEFYELTVGGVSVRMYISKDGSEASWMQDGYFFSLLCPPSFDQTGMIDLIGSVAAD